MTTGLLYRRPTADAATLLSLAEQIVEWPCWNFGGASLWDVKTEPEQLRDNLRPITKITSSEHIDLSGDFGHIFSSQAELRWKRRSRESYDVLILTETILSTNGLIQLGDFEVTDVDERTWIYLDTPQDEQAQGLRWRLGYREYRGKNGVVQFVRYTKLNKEEQRP